jgi:transposase
MQVNARPHTVRVVTDYYHENNVQMLDWPPQSPDLNPIEQIWAIMKQKIYTQKSFPENKSELIASFFRIWDELPESLLVNLSDSIFLND